MKQFHSEDAWMTFESNGIPPLFQFLVCEVYLPPGNLLIYDGRTWREHILARLIPALNEEGKRLYRNDSLLRAAFQKTQQTELEIAAICKEIDRIERVPWETVDRLFEKARGFMAPYRYFDTWFSDGAYENRHDPDTAQALLFGGATKNRIRERLNVIFFESDKGIPAALRRIGQGYGVPLDDLNWYLPEEVQALCEGRALTPETLAARRQGYVFFIDVDETRTFIEGEEAKRYIKEFDSDRQNIEMQSIQGKTAHGTGVIRGSVRIIIADYIDFSKTQKAMEEMQVGDIMVSTTTAPDVLPAMRKASAIVTDLGGMLSHAAITARELDTPCVVGTKVATEVFKDGDLVEVDATEGTVRILERKV